MLRNVSTVQKNLIMSGFAHSIRQNKFGKVKKKMKLMGNTVDATLHNVSETFCKCSLRNPTLDEDGIKSIIVSKQLKGYKKKDPARRYQLALPLSIFEKIYFNQKSSLNMTMGQLIMGALFFAMRSCKYSLTPKHEEKKTKLLCLYNLQFFDGSTEITNINQIQNSQLVRITFESTKTDVKDVSVIQHRTNKELCPVKFWVKIKQRLLSYPRTSEKSTVNTILINGKLKQIASSQIRAFIRSIVLETDPFQKHFDISRIGTHSVCTSTAMILHCAKKETYIIMMLG